MRNHSPARTAAKTPFFGGEGRRGRRTMIEDRDWFEAVWKHREERIYPDIFGGIGEGIYPLSAQIFSDTFHQDFDPRWLNHGVFESPPCNEHRSWLYVTSGLSNAWEDESSNPDGPSGLGREFVFESTTRGEWAILRVQHIMAFQILLAHGRYPGCELLELYDRVPLRSSITPEPSSLTYIMVAPPLGYNASFDLESGHVDLLALVGITDAEAQFARDTDGATLLERLKDCGAFPITDPKRACTIAS